MGKGTFSGFARLVTGVAAVGLFVGVGAAQDPAGPGARARAGDARVGGFATDLTIDVKEKSLVEVVAYIRQQTGKNIMLGKNAEGKPIDTLWPPITVTVKFEEVPWEQALGMVAEAANCLVERDGPIFRIYQPPVVTIEMERADLRDVVQAIAAVSGANVLVGSDVPDELPVSVRLRNIAWFHALSAVVKSVGMTLVKEEVADIWIIRDPEKLKKVLETRVWRLKFVRPVEEYGAKIKSDKVASPTTSATLTVDQRVKNFTLLRAIEKGLTQDGTGKPIGGVDYDIVTNSLIISDVPSKLDEVDTIITKLDVEPTQVQVDVKFVSTTYTDVLDVGVNWRNGLQVRATGGAMNHRMPFDLGTGGFDDDIGLSNSGGNFVRGPTPTDVNAFSANNYTFGILDFQGLQALTSFLKTDGKSQITQRPSITVLDNFPATIFVGETVRYAKKTFTASQSGGLVGAVEEADNSPVSTGFQLLVLPHVVPGTKKIVLTLVPTLDALTGRTSLENPGFDTFKVGTDSLDLPRLSSATLVTQMILEDGETAVLGGMIKETEIETVTKLPLLGDIPLLGYLFKSVQTSREKQNIVVFVTVRVVRTKRDATEALENQLRSRVKDLRAEYYENVRRTEMAAAPAEAPAADKPKGLSDDASGNKFHAGGATPAPRARDWDRSGQ